ncbi:malate dehydrogenase [Candidatus Marinamargulisbacteria bacterium]|nr:malate dehydrogenase [Candidatus Marinamargulisbacteria bacterium]
MNQKKITVVGAGHVGATAAQRLLEKQLGPICLIDVVEGLAAGKALDMMQSGATEGFGTQIVGTTDYADTANSDIVLITAGIARKPGMSRDDLLATNAKIVLSIVDQIIAHSPNTIIVMVTNPLDVMTQLAADRVGYPNRVVGMAGVLDSSRYACFIAEALQCSIQDVRAMVLGGHGDTMVPVPQYSTVNGVPITELLPADTIEAINKRTQTGGAEIVQLLKTGSAYYAPSASAVAMVEAIALDTNRLLPACVKLNGEYGISDIYCGVPVRMGASGLVDIVTISLTDEQQAALHQSAESVRETYLKCQELVQVK